MVVRKIRKVGGSEYVVLNKNYLKALKIKLGDYVIIALRKNGIIIKKLKAGK